MIHTVNSRRAWVCAALLVVLAVPACRKQSRPADAVPEAATPAPAAVDWSKIPEEPYDPTAKQKPRLQFLWPAPGEERASIWSVALDGSDLRRVASPAWLYGGEVKTIDPPLERSPDGRYIAAIAHDEEDWGLRILIDRKTRTVKTMQEALGLTPIVWTPDSKRVLFYGEPGLMEYAVETGTLTELPRIHANVFRLVDGGQKFLTVSEEGFRWYDRQGKQLRQVPIGFSFLSVNGISTDGRRVLFSISEGEAVAETERPDQRTAIGSLRGVEAAFGPGGTDLYYYLDGRLHRFDVATRKVIDLTELPGLPALGVSLVAD